MCIDNRLVRLYVTCIAIYFANLSKSGAKIARIIELAKYNANYFCSLNLQDKDGKSAQRCALLLFVIPYPDKVARLGEGFP